MNRKKLEKIIESEYGGTPEKLWLSHPGYTVYRHAGSGKWYALIMDVPRDRLGLPGTETLDVVNLKCDPKLIGSLAAQPGFFPAYHMSKTGWISAALDGSAADKTVRLLLDMSYEATAARPRRKAPGGAPAGEKK